MPEIIDIMEAEIGIKCEYAPVPNLDCKDDAICTVIFNSGKMKKLCKKHLRIELNKELDQ